MCSAICYREETNPWVGNRTGSQNDVIACRENYTSHHVQKSYVTTNAIIIVVDISSALQCYSLRMRISSKWRVQVSQGESAFIRKRFPYPSPYCILCSVCVVFIPTALLYSVQCILYFILCSVKLTEQYRSDYTAIVLQLTNALHLWCVVVVLCYTNLSHEVG